MKVAFYVTSHGFGHASRVSALVTEFIKYGIDCYIITDRPKFLFPQESGYCHIIERQTDTGMIQENWKVPSVEKTFSKLQEFWVTKEEIVEAERYFLQKKGIELVVVDIPYLPILAAKKLNIPVYAVTNFDWYFNYIEIVDQDTNPKILEILAEILQIYQQCDKSYILPFSNEKSVQALPNQVKCGNLAKYSLPNRKSICKEFKIDEGKKLALITFGGIMSDISYFQSLTANQEYVFLTNTPIRIADNVILLPRNYDYSLLISSCDVVITKVGYSTLAETCAAGTYLCYATRDSFPEDEPLVAELSNYPYSQHFKLLDDSIDIHLPQGEITKYHHPRYALKNGEIALNMIKAFMSKKYDNLKAVIDFGTNNSTLLIYSLKSSDFELAFYDVRITGIGLGFSEGIISQGAFKKAKHELSIQLEFCKKLGLLPHILVTNIGRVADNFILFQKAIDNLYQVDWEIISPDREAKLGVNSSLFWNPDRKSFYNVDIGGSSIEISLVKNRKVQNVISMECGILTYYHKYKDSRLNFEQISELIQQDMEHFLDENAYPIKESHTMLGIGKVFQNLSCIYEGKENYESFEMIKEHDLQDLMFTLHTMINDKSRYNYHDCNGKMLTEIIFYISLGILQSLNNILHTTILVINPWGIEFGYLLENKERTDEI